MVVLDPMMAKEADMGDLVSRVGESWAHASLT